MRERRREERALNDEGTRKDSPAGSAAAGTLHCPLPEAQEFPFMHLPLEAALCSLPDSTARAGDYG